MTVHSSVQQNRQGFDALVDRHIQQASAHFQKLMQAGGSAVASHMGKDVSTLSTEALTDICRRFGWSAETAMMSQMQAFVAQLSRERFEFARSAAGYASRDEALEDDNLWNRSETAGVSQDMVREAAERVWQSAVDQDVLAFLTQCATVLLTREQREAARWLTVGDERYEVVDSAAVLWSGWECDDKAWVIRKNDKLVLMATNHGQQYEATSEFLTERIRAYEQAIAASKRLLDLLGSP